MTYQQNNDLITESRNIFTKSVLREKVSYYLVETFLIIEDKIGRELTIDELENILILLTDETP